MNLSFTRLFQSVINSDAWLESKERRICWITLIMMADKFGCIDASILAVASRSGLTLKETEDAVLFFMGTKCPEDMQLAEVDGVGWALVNYERFKKILDMETRRQQNAQSQARFRSKAKV